MTVKFRVAIMIFLCSCVAFTLILQNSAQTAKANIANIDIVNIDKVGKTADALPLSKGEQALLATSETEPFRVSSSIYFEPLLLLLLGSALMSFATGIKLIASRKLKHKSNAL